MDPQETWRMLLDTWFCRHWNDVVELSEALQNWLSKDGFAPQVEHPRQLGADLNRTIVLSTSQFVKHRALTVLESANGIPLNVPFTLTCSECNNEGPDNFAQAVAEGWEDVEYVTHLPAENFLGCCLACLDRNS